jgi:ABC-type Fe3+ transport system permease subunit
MHRPIRRFAHAAAAAALLCAAAVPASEERTDVDDAPSAEQMAVDLVVLRPLGLAGTVIGTAVFIVALPFNALTLNFKDPARRLILEPAEYTFVRELGDIE